MDRLYIETDSALADLCKRLADLPSFCLDTEFMREKTYFSKVCVIQVAAEDFTAVIDAVAVPTFDRFLDLLVDPRIEKVLHAAKEDLEIFYWAAGRPVVNVYDVQPAASMLGLGQQLSYHRLVKLLTGLPVSKVEKYSYWDRRPLTPKQIEYAHADVEHLPLVARRLRDKLTALGRTEWLRDELKGLEDPAMFSREPREAWRRVPGHGRLSGRDLAVLREVAAWREETARRYNVPVRWTLSDEGLIHLAQRAPDDLRSLRKARGLHPNEIARSGDLILAAVRRGLELPSSEWPELPPQPAAPADDAVVDLLAVCLRALAAQADIGPEFLATRGELVDFVRAWHEGNRDDGVPLLQGWRRKIAGDALLRVLRGELRVSVAKGGRSVTLLEA